MHSQFVFISKMKIKQAFPLLVHTRFLFSLSLPKDNGVTLMTKMMNLLSDALQAYCYRLVRQPTAILRRQRSHPWKCAPLINRP